MKVKNVLIMGAGAIGRVIGTHLRLSGCDVTFWVRPSHLESLQQQGITLYNLSSETELHLSAPQLITEPASGASYDALFICVRSDQLDDALAQIKQHFAHAEEMKVVVMQPGRDDALKAFRALPETIVVPAAPSFAAYFNGERIDYWAAKQLPTLIGPPFNETLQVRDELVRLLQQGGIPAKGVSDLEAETRFPTAALSTLISAFALAGYSFKQLAGDSKMLALTAQAIREAIAITKKDLGFIPAKYKPLEYINGKTLASFFWVLEKSSLYTFQQALWAAHAPKIEKQNFAQIDDLLTLGLQQSKNPPPALTALAAMTPEKIGDYLRSTRQFEAASNKNLKLGLALGFGGLVAWKLLVRKRS